ncbi:hypothetical protein G9A89_005244 [Geosiphon pyriformis]|nr:hypothetical protein G9A89_005244 [Geosiphon pyriformis]
MKEKCLVEETSFNYGKSSAFAERDSNQTPTGSKIKTKKALVTFTSELSLVQTSKKAEEAKILVNTNLKKSSEHLDQAVVLKEIPIRTSTKTVHAVLSEFGIIKSIKMQLVGLWQKAVVEFEQVDHADLVTAK